MEHDMPVVEHWMYEPDVPLLRAHVLANCRVLGRDLEPQEVDTDWVLPDGGGPSLDLLACYAVGPHVDSWHPQWSALWVVQHAEGHVFHIADRKVAEPHKRVRKPPKALTQTVPLSVGQVVLFNAHRVHWLPAVAERKMLLVASFEFKSRPTREQVNARIAEAAHRVGREPTAGMAA